VAHAINFLALIIKAAGIVRAHLRGASPKLAVISRPMAETTSPETLALLYLRRIDERLDRFGHKLEAVIVGLSRIEREVTRRRTARRPKASSRTARREDHPAATGSE
jgi:hypothetical protein